MPPLQPLCASLVCSLSYAPPPPLLLPRRLGDLLPAASRAWLPWVPYLGTSIPLTSLQLLRQHAARVLVPSAFHRTFLMQLLGLPPTQVAVLPQPVPPEHWCPPDFGSLPGRQALQASCGRVSRAVLC